MTDAADLLAVLSESQRLGFLGDRRIEEVIVHARLFVDALAELDDRDDSASVHTVVDLGAGGGVPGLVIAHDRPDLDVILLDRRTKRTDFLERSVRRLRWTERVTVVAADADAFIRDDHRTIDAVVARGFGPPELTLLVASRCARPGGWIVISEPPHGDRWEPSWLRAAGVERVATAGRSGGVATFRTRH